MKRTLLALVLIGAIVGAVLLSGVRETRTAGAEPANSADGGGASFGASCDWSHRAAKDPITNPGGTPPPDGSPDMTHVHEFYGNKSTKNFTYASMVKADSSCNRRGAQTSSYWFPAVRWNGVQLQPKDAIIYYKHNNKNHKSIAPFPKNLKVIVDQNEGAIRWSCGNNEEGAQAVPPERCTNPKEPLTVKIRFPDCWNGESLGTREDNEWRTHMRFSRTGNDGFNHCSDGWRPMAQIQMRTSFRAPNDQGTFPDGPEGGAVTVSHSPTMWVPPGNGNMHADFWNTWNQEELKDLTRICINNVGPKEDRPPRCQSSEN